MDLLSGVSSSIQLDARQGALYSQPHMIIKKSTSSIVNQFYQPDSRSISNVTWSTIQPPSKSTIIDRKWYMDLSVKISFSGDAGASNYLLPIDERFPSSIGANGKIGQLDTRFLGLRALPFNACVGNTQLSINGTSVTNNTSQFSNVFPYLFVPDQTNVYEMVSNPDTWQAIPQYQYNNNNPMALYGTSQYNQTRGDAKYTVLYNTQTAAQIQIDWYESLIVPSLLKRNNDYGDAGLVGVSNINLVLSLQNLTNVIELANWGVPDYEGNTYPTVAPITISGQPQPAISLEKCNLLLTFITPTIAMPPVPLPAKYNYDNFYTLTTTCGSNPYAAGASDVTTSNNIQLSTIPSKILIYVGKAQQKGTDLSGNLLPNYNFTDTMAVIDKISINFNNQSGLLSGSNPYQLYQISQSNGCTQSWAQWSNYQGSLMVLNLQKDLPSDVLSAVGANQTNNFVVQVNWHDANPSAIIVNPTGAPDPDPLTNPNKVNYQLYVVMVYDEVFTIGEIASSVTQSFDSIHVLRDLQEGRVDTSILDFEHYQAPHAQGMGSFWSDIGKSLRRGVRSVGNYLATHPNVDKGIVGALGTAASMLAPEFAPAIAVGVKGIDALIDHYLGKGYSDQEIMGILASQYPKSMIESALIQASGGRRVSKRRLVKRRY